MRRKLPTGVQSFEKMRRDGYVYVDKTAYVFELVQTSLPYFLSRPRRFGKSLFVSTLRAYFEGRRELFAGLAIETLEETLANKEGREPWRVRPVLNLSFNSGNFTREDELERYLGSVLRDWEVAWEVATHDGSLGQRFLRVLRAAHEASGHRVAVLVDEYDKPLLECMSNPVLEERNRAMLKGFYGALKDGDEHLRFAFIAGVTKFSKVSIFSDLNQLEDLTLSAAYAAICGITEEELLANFGPELDAMACERGEEREDCIDALRVQYDGYLFHHKAPGVYNPYSLLRALKSRELGSYWFQSGTPTFLVERMRDSEFSPRRLTDGSIYATENRLSDYRVDDLDPIPLLFQSGYLTIRRFDTFSREYELGVPNEEVKWGLVESLLPVYAPAYSGARGTDIFSLRRLVEAGNTEGIRNVLTALFASIPYTRTDDPFENHFQSVVWLTFTLLGRYTVCEVHQAYGRVDCVVETRAHVYVMEFKRNGTAAEALAQIVEKGYALPFCADSRELHVIGCAFNPKTRRLVDWVES